MAEIVYNVVMGFVCIFDYINLKEGPTRLKHMFYYTVLSMEAAILMSLWYLEIKKQVIIFVSRMNRGLKSVVFNSDQKMA